MLRVALVGCGAIGSVLAKAIDRGRAGRTELCWLYDVREDASRRLAGRLKVRPRVAGSIDEICSDRRVGLVIEAASQEAVREYALKVLRSGKDFVVLSVGAFADGVFLEWVRKTAEQLGRRVYIPSGAIVGIDGVAAASVEGLDSVLLVTRKPPKALADAPYVKRLGLDLSKLKGPRVLFEGPARKAVKLFPTSVNVAATLSLAGVGFGRTTVRIIADPSLKRNVHEIYLRGRAGEIIATTKNVQMREAPGTSRLAALSTIRLLRSLAEAVRVGT